MNNIDQMRLNDFEYPEKNILARLIKWPELRKDLKLQPKHFWDDRHAAIVEALINNPGLTDAHLMNDAIRNKSAFGGYEFVDTLINYPIPSKHGMTNDQLEVYHYYKQREIKKKWEDYEADPSDENALEMSGRIQELNQFEVHEDSSKLEIMSEILDDLHNVNETPVTPTGFKTLDSLIGGFEDGQLNVIAARPSLGKTALALQLGKQLAKDNNEVVFCSMETREKNLTQRLLANIAKVSLSKFKNAARDMSKEEVDRVTDAMSVYHKMNLKIVEKPQISPSEIRGIANSMSDAEHGFIIIDYLQLMHSDKKHNSKYEEVSQISRELKVITQEFQNISIIAIAQLNRGVEQRQDKRPMMSDLRDSGGIEQDASMIMMLYRDDYYHEPKDKQPGAPSELDVIVAKNKDGEVGTAKLEYYKNIQRIY
ncbi:hypothetical protein WN59_06695 [Salinicoccus sediminis]|uniref:SF4 helicase domain-containing protein n=1 Tax=Salinicoccus sediminis TaxID=1432562 RepID=A0A0M2SKD3_9STAP|nr:DnaB helicase C-terminal domain-containing protein [Salinicoccus sediminis]KKK34713.1 hypothetical protein WN59_06695 [Salinicoccus sediminis]